MWFISEIASFFNLLGDAFRTLADRALDVPLIGNWLANYFYDAAIYFYRLSVDTSELDRWADDVASRLGGILSWDQIRSYITSAWTWLDTIDDKIRDVAIARVRAIWTWLDTIDDKIRDVAIARVRDTWTWLDTIDDKIALEIRTRLEDTLWQLLEDSVRMVSRVAYRVLNALWNMEWDEENKEVK